MTPAILAIDSAATILSLGLEAASGRWFFEADAGLRHSELLMDGIGTLLDKAGVAPSELSGVVCMGGPGSFTGLRIAFATAKGLGLALGIPFVPVPSLDCMAMPYADWPGITVPVIDAKRNAFFCALYRNGSRICDYMDAEPARITHAISAVIATGEPVLLAGTDAAKLASAFKNGTGPDCNVVCANTHERRGYAAVLLGIAKNGEIFNTYNTDWNSGPLYIRDEPVIRTENQCEYNIEK